MMTMGGARADGIVSPLYLYNTNPVTDVLWHNLPGSYDGSNSAARVEIRVAGTNSHVVVFAPDPLTGEGNEAANPLFLVSYMGDGFPIDVNPGKFSVCLTNRLPSASTNIIWFFTRVYDNPSVSNAIYYADSQVFKDVPVDQRYTETTLTVAFQSRHRVDGTTDLDSDGDGIPDDIENNVTGTDPNMWDSDEDGYSDWFEAHYSEYMHPNQKDARLVIYINTPVNEGVDPHMVSWDTIPVPDMMYRLDYRPKWVDGDSYSNIWSGTATETNLEVDVEDWVQTNSPVKGFFRVTVPYAGP